MQLSLAEMAKHWTSQIARNLLRCCCCGLAALHCVAREQNHNTTLQRVRGTARVGLQEASALHRQVAVLTALRRAHCTAHGYNRSAASPAPQHPGHGGGLQGHGELPFGT